MVDRRSILFITLDSCRYDTFADVRPTNLSRVGHLYRAMAPSTFTYGSHAAMFVGFTPGVFNLTEPYVNPKFGRIFKMLNRGTADRHMPWVVLNGRNIIEGFKRLGYRTIGAGGVNWFNPETPTAQMLLADFDDFFYGGKPVSIRRQVDFLSAKILDVDGQQPVFAFANVAETHVPYHFEGAPWSADTNPCVPFGAANDAAECGRRQSASLQFVDDQLAPLLDSFRSANVVVCADHGDAWGEDGLWEHGISHEKVLEVPLLFRLENPPVPG
jgi:Sulfatase